MKIILFILTVLLSTKSYADKIQVQAFDFGPLARGDLGIVFSTGKIGSGEM